MAKSDVPPQILARIEETLAQKPTVLFMKGNRRMPQCGFSARVVEVLDRLGVEYATVNILADPDLREHLKSYAEWPTFPQLYHRGQLIGGCDIVVGMAERGELSKTLTSG